MMTQELAREIADAIEDMRGVRPHMVISDLSRIKLDPNRERGEATGGLPEQSYAMTMMSIITIYKCLRMLLLLRVLDY